MTGDNSSWKAAWEAAADPDNEPTPSHFERVRREAARGDFRAQYRLGLIYEKSTGPFRNAKKAALWYRKSGISEAKKNLALMYVIGSGVEKDLAAAEKLLSEALHQIYNPWADDSYVEWYQEAVRLDFPYAHYKMAFEVSGDDERIFWLKKAAEGGYAKAQYDLGSRYEDGHWGLEADGHKALEWYQKAADQGYVIAEHRLGEMYDFGQIVEQDDRKAFVWYQKAADQNWSDAQHTLSVMYAEGRGVDKDEQKSRVWFLKSLENGEAGRLFEFGWKYEIGLLIEQNGNNIEEALKRYHKSAEMGLPKAQYHLGLMYAQGELVAKDAKKAVEWYQKAAESDHLMALNNLGRMYECGEGLDKDEARAVEYYQKAADQGHATAQYNLGVMYETGAGVAQDINKAVECYQKAAEQGDAWAQYNLGVMYGAGRGVAQDANKAVECYQKAAEQGNARAQNNLGRMYETGAGVAQDINKAVEFYQKAAEQGLASACEKLNRLQKPIGKPGRHVPLRNIVFAIFLIMAAVFFTIGSGLWKGFKRLFGKRG